jgi:NitT/TauT family transport system ATP-binding protein
MTIDTHAAELPAARELAVRELRKVYPVAGGELEAIHHLDFTVPAGQFVCIVGPSGAGKTTLLRCVAGLQPPTTGVVELGGEKVEGPPTGLGIVFQDYSRSLLPWLTVRRNVELPLREKGVDRATRHELVDAALEAVGLTDSTEVHPYQLSGGMQQRVAIARAVAYQPNVLIMDEPFAAVDAQTRADLEDLVRRLWLDLGTTTLFVTHDIDESIYLSERVLVLTRRPTRVLADIKVDLPREREQVATRSCERFGELRSIVHGLIQEAKRETPS